MPTDLTSELANDVLTKTTKRLNIAARESLSEYNSVACGLASTCEAVRNAVLHYHRADGDTLRRAKCINWTEAVFRAESNYLGRTRFFSVDLRDTGGMVLCPYCPASYFIPYEKNPDPSALEREERRALSRVEFLEHTDRMVRRLERDLELAKAER